MPNEPSKYHPLLVSSATTAEPFLATLDSALPCSVAAQCGGCPEFGEPPAAQRRRKGQRLAQLLAEQGLEPPVVPWLGGETLRYRNRIRVALRDGVPGYFNRDKDPAVWFWKHPY